MKTDRRRALKIKALAGLQFELVAHDFEPGVVDGVGVRIAEVIGRRQSSDDSPLQHSP